MTERIDVAELRRRINERPKTTAGYVPIIVTYDAPGREVSLEIAQVYWSHDSAALIIVATA
jgi:hypothetical protein